MSYSTFLRLWTLHVWPKIDFAIRLILGQMFFISGVLKITHWDTALYLAAHEYPVSWLSPTAAAYIGAIVEFLGGSLLIAGLLTRYAAFALLVLTLVIQLEYRALDSQLLQVAVLGWFTVQGAGTWSIDRLLRRGLAESALPLVPAIVRASAAVRHHGTPWFLFALRIWIAAAFALATLRRPSMPGAALSTITHALPLAAVALFPTSMAASAALLWFLGVGTRILAIVLSIALTVGAMMDIGSTNSIYWLMLFAVFMSFGPGALSLDTLIETRLARRRAHRNALLTSDARSCTTPKVVIIGAGFGGMSCAAALRRAQVDVTIVDRANHHLFQPLLYQVATAALSPSDIATPVRSLFRDAQQTRVLFGAVTNIDTTQRLVVVNNHALPYDYLVLATGAAHSYFGKDQWALYAPGLKRIEDATEIRRRILTAFERAEATNDDAERASLLTFLIVGGGPTGVELAGAIAELARFGMEKEFRRFDPAQARVILVQSAARLLPAFPDRLATLAQASLESLGVQVLTHSRVEDIGADGVSIDGRHIPARTVLWAAGVMASPAATWLGVAADSAGRVKVGADLSVPGMSNVFAVGDTAASLAWKGQPVPGLAPAAKQGGHYVARQIIARVRKRAAPAPFAYRHLGSLATIGRKSAVADFGWIKLWGAPAWWLWGVVHIGFLVGLRNRVITMINWFWSYLTFRGGVRLITGAESGVARANTTSAVTST